MEVLSQHFLNKYHHMVKVGHPFGVIEQVASVDVQCDINDPMFIQVSQYLSDYSQGLMTPVPYHSLDYLIQTKYQRMREKGIGDEKVQIYEYKDKLFTQKKSTQDKIYQFLFKEMEGYENSSEDRTLGDSKEPTFTESQLRAAELKKEAKSLEKNIQRTTFMKTSVEEKQEEVDTSPLVELGHHQKEIGEFKKIEFHDLVGIFPEPEILRTEIFDSKCVFREHIKDRLFTFLNVFSKDECDKLRVMLDFSEEEQKVQGELLKTVISSNQPLVRTNIRRHFIDNQVSMVIWRTIKAYLPKTLPDGRGLVGVRTKMNYYRYGPGQYFKTHIDGGYRFTGTGETSEFTFVIYLNHDFKGGATRFCSLPEWNNEIREVVPVQGGMLVFRQHDTKHCGVILESGYKHILQGMVMYGPLRTNALGQPFGKEAQLFHTCEC